MQQPTLKCLANAASKTAVSPLDMTRYIDTELTPRAILFEPVLTVLLLKFATRERGSSYLILLEQICCAKDVFLFQ